MVIDDKEEGTTKFANLVKRTIRGGSVDVRLVWFDPQFFAFQHARGSDLLAPDEPFNSQVPINAEGEKSQVTFPSAIEMAILAKKVPAEWVDAREVRDISG